jgi:2-dehydro-3-deoxyglucarate aldolase
MTSPAPSRNIPNLFRQAVLAQQRLIGCWCALASPISTEVLGVAGFDWILLDAEHAPNELPALVLQQMALKDSRSAPVVRPAWNDTVQIKRLLDAGFCNFLVPFIESPEAARQAVAATRYPPEGVRGVSVSQRANRYGSVADYFQLANQNITVLLQIESRAGMDAAAAIAAVHGVDGLFVGPSDLAAAFGHLGQPGHPEVQQAIGQIFAAARSAGKASGILAPVEADARRYLAMGASFVAVGSDLGVLRMGTQALADKFREPGAAPITAQY